MTGKSWTTYIDSEEKSNLGQYIDSLEKALDAARGALLSYRYGNQSPDLADEVVAKIDEILPSRKEND